MRDGDIYSLADFQREADDCTARLRDTRGLAVLTVDGKAELVVQRAESYQELLDRIDELETMVDIQEGFDSIGRGEGAPLHEVVKEIRRRVKARASGEPKAKDP